MSKGESSGFKTLIIIGLIGLALYALYLLVVWSIKAFVFLGYNAFFFLDNLFSITPFNPIVMWCVWGLLLGSIIGVIMAVKKYKLSKILILYPIGAVVLLITIMGFVNHPAAYNGNYKPQPVNNVIAVPKNYYILNTDANVRSGPSVKDTKLFVLIKGAVVEVIQTGFFDSRKVEWYKIKYNYQEGYINAKLLTFSHTSN